MILDTWAERWNVPAAALADLRMLIGIETAPVLKTTGEQGSETRQQGLIRLDADKHGVILTRNNVGVLRDERNVPVRYGLFNESKAQNVAFKSSDLIGIRSILIGPQHVGKVIGQFVAREAKHEDWTFKGDAHEQAQLKFINFIVAKGGDAAFANGPGSFDNRRV